MAGEPLVCVVDRCTDAYLARGFCSYHYGQWRRRTPIEERRRKTPEQRFWPKVNRDGPVPAARPDLCPCWLWIGAKNPNGYGQFWWNGRLGLAHRYAYELLVGPFPDGLEPDHLCRVRGCVRPDHLEPVTHQENSLRGDSPPARQARQTHCKNGHAFTLENTRLQINRAGRAKRHCRTCAKAWKQARRAVNV